jgi:hypothetical protein
MPSKSVTSTDSLSMLSQFKATWPTTVFSTVLFCAVTYLLFWNESQAIMTSRALDDASRSLIEIDAFDREALLATNGNLVHICGPIAISEPLTEPDYNIRVLSVKLKKRVQMYQWIEEATETESDIGSYQYYKDWRDYLVDSNLFYISPGHHNPKDMPTSGQTHIAEIVSIGGLYLGLDVKKKFSDYYDITSDERPDRHDIKLHSGSYYHGADPLVHEIGDLRVMFSYAGRNNDIYCVIGIVEKYTINPYISLSSPEPLILLRKGKHSAKDMLMLEFRDAGWVAWRFRAVGWFQMFAAAMSLHPDWFELLLSHRWVSPRVRRQGRVSTNLIAATCGTLFIIASAWIVYAPIFSLTLLGVAIIPIIYFSSAAAYTRLPNDEHQH